DEVTDHIPEPAFEDGRRHRLRAQRDREVVYYSLQVVLADVDLSVSRHHDAHVVTQAAQLLRQRGGDVGHAARLGERGELGRGYQHLELLRARSGRGGAVAGDAQAERARWRHLLDVARLATHHHRHLQRLTGAAAQRLQGYGDEERIGRLELGERLGTRLLLIDAPDGQLGTLRVRHDPYDVRGVETEVGR